MVTEEPPSAEALTYLDRSREYWRQAQEHLELGHLEKAAELAWGSTAERVKALALARTGTYLRSHKAIRDFVKRIANQVTDKDLFDMYGQAERLHIDFYEAQFDTDEVRTAFAHVDRLLRKVDSYLESTRVL